MGKWLQRSFNGTLWREILNTEYFLSTQHARTGINAWLKQYNCIRPHKALEMHPPVPETPLETNKINGTDKWD